MTDVSFDIRKGEIRAIIGPNGAGKTSMLNVINGFYHPQKGRITFRGRDPSRRCSPHEAAAQGIARTFQNVALFKGMTALDNIMAGRNLKMKRGLFWQALRLGPALDEEIEHRQVCEEIIDFPRDPAHPQDAGRRACPTACRSASSSAARWRWSRICCCSTSRWPA